MILNAETGNDSRRRTTAAGLRPTDGDADLSQGCWRYRSRDPHGQDRGLVAVTDDELSFLHIVSGDPVEVGDYVRVPDPSKPSDHDAAQLAGPDQVVDRCPADFQEVGSLFDGQHEGLCGHTVW